MAAVDPREVDAEALHAEADPADGEKPELEDFANFKVTAPIFPWEIVVRQSQSFFQKTPSGGMQVKFCPAVTAVGRDAPGFVIEFGADGWERFKKVVAADGEAPPEIATATILPPSAAPRG